MLAGGADGSAGTVVLVLAPHYWNELELLFTISTPIYVTLIYDFLQGHRLRLVYLLTAVIAVIGAAVIRYDHISRDFIIGFLLIQGANIVFALGQVGYKRIMELYPLPQHQAFAWVYLGAILVASIGWFL